MKLHEYQAKQLFASVGIPTPRGEVARTAAEAAKAYETLTQRCGSFTCNVKAQLHAGGRGKAGGVLVARSASEASAHAAGLLGRRLVTAQTGPEGLPVSAVLIEERVKVREERYLAVTVDRFRAQPLALASLWGGVDIETVATSKPSAIRREPFDITAGPQEAALDRIASALGLWGVHAVACGRTVQALWSLFISSDASLIEINPLVAAADGRLLALDAKMTLDDNALFRHPDLAALRDESQEPPLEREASRVGISYVGLEGNIGCLVNGAGLAMATNDIIKLSGGSPANFLDVGGGANIEQVTNAFAIILADPRVKAILVNIFGGIMRCDWVAQGLLNATQRLDVKVPIVVRLQGTNVEAGRRLLAPPPVSGPPMAGPDESAPMSQPPAGRQVGGLNLVSVDELADAARKVVELARQ